MPTYYNYKNILVAQHPDMPIHFLKIINEFDRIIEIGSERGGLTWFLFDNKSTNCELISYDIDEHKNLVPKPTDIDFRIGDCFEEKTRSEIEHLIAENNKRVLLLCDGGNKIREFAHFSKFLKWNDVIMQHDYADNHSDFLKYAKPIGWDVCGYTGTYGNALNTIIECKLSKYEYYDDFKSIFWGAFIKNIY